MAASGEENGHWQRELISTEESSYQKVSVQEDISALLA